MFQYNSNMRHHFCFVTCAIICVLLCTAGLRISSILCHGIWSQMHEIFQINLHLPEAKDPILTQRTTTLVDLLVAIWVS